MSDARLAMSEKELMEPPTSAIVYPVDGDSQMLTLCSCSTMLIPTWSCFADPTNKTLNAIENQARCYIALKTALSFVTGMVVAVILLALQVKLAVMFGLLSFLLNFIPNVDSMIAMVLP